MKFLVTLAKKPKEQRWYCIEFDCEKRKIREKFVNTRNHNEQFLWVANWYCEFTYSS